MITNQWYAIASSQEVTTKYLKGLIRFGEKLVLWRDQHNKVVCMNDRCCHRGMALSAGRIVNGCIECPYHGLQFDSEGYCQHIPANGEQAHIPKGIVMKTYPLQEAHGLIWMWWGDHSNSLPPLPWFEELETCFSCYTSPPMTMAIHYSRIIENLLDVAHLPIAHSKSFGSVIAPVVDTLANVEWDGDRIKVRSSVRFQKGKRNRYVDVCGREDDGSAPLTQLPDNRTYKEEPFDAQFKFPASWRVGFNVSWFGKVLYSQFYSSVVICPIDNHTSIIYTSTHQRFTKLPILKTLICYIANLYDRKVGLEEDRIIVEKQSPHYSFLGMNEKLLDVDRPIILYRQQRQRLLEEGGGRPEFVSDPPVILEKSSSNPSKQFVLLGLSIGLILFVLGFIIGTHWHKKITASSNELKTSLEKFQKTTLSKVEQ